MKNNIRYELIKIILPIVVEKTVGSGMTSYQIAEDTVAIVDACINMAVHGPREGVIRIEGTLDESIKAFQKQYGGS
jgi:hypothetical protein